MEEISKIGPRPRAWAVLAGLPFWKALVFYWIPVLALVAAMSYLSSLTSSTLDKAIGSAGGIRVNDMLFHVAEFGILSLFAYRLARFHLRWSYLFLSIAVLAAVAAYGSLDELHQAFVPGRSFSTADILADALGSLLALALIGGGTALRRALWASKPGVHRRG